ncbi:MAG: DUF3482 domain-containing protein [Planctomycetota bacterium]
MKDGDPENISTHVGGLPRFAVVGHPNKGKSSLVATLTGVADIDIRPESGTTRVSATYPVVVQGQTLYELVDTPGFQRARGVWAWLEAQDVAPDQRAAAVARFVRAPEHAERFPDEVELLKPLVDPDRPAGLLYVVDGAAPFGREYEPEMEVLRWTGRPSLALINPIGAATHVEAWRAALGQYFRVVRVLDAVRARWDQRLDLLRAFGQLDEAWRVSLDHAVGALSDRRAEQAESAAWVIARAVADLMAHTETAARPEDASAGEEDALRESLRTRLAESLTRIERQARREVEELYGHPGLEREERALPAAQALSADLFSEQTWVLFGLSRADWTKAGAAGGALAGGVIDVSLAGASFLMGAAVGAAAGAAAGWWSGGRVAALPVTRKWLGGGRKLVAGPAPGPTLGYVALSRALLHARLVAERTHAQRGALVVPDSQEVRQADAGSTPDEGPTSESNLSGHRASDPARDSADAQVRALLEVQAPEPVRKELGAAVLQLRKAGRSDDRRAAAVRRLAEKITPIIGRG